MGSVHLHGYVGVAGMIPTKTKKLLSLYDANIEQADYMKIVFEAQKNDMKNQSVYHDQTNHPTLCPIKIWARIIERIMNFKGTSLN